jgi:hypothetical protein
VMLINYMLLSIASWLTKYKPHPLHIRPRSMQQQQKNVFNSS